MGSNNKNQDQQEQPVSILVGHRSGYVRDEDGAKTFHQGQQKSTQDTAADGTHATEDDDDEGLDRKGFPHGRADEENRSEESAGQPGQHYAEAESESTRFLYVNT